MDIICIEMAKVRQIPEVSKAPHVFEIRLQNITYFVGEDPTFGGRDGDFLVSPESGTGLEQARYWEHSIRQALMPVTPTTSVVSEGKLLMSPPPPLWYPRVSYWCPPHHHQCGIRG